MGADLELYSMWKRLRLCSVYAAKRTDKDQTGTYQLVYGFEQKNEVHTAFLADIKKALGTEKSAQLFQAIRSYKKTDDYESLVTTVVSLFTERDENFNLLIRFGVFVRPHHKKQYREMLDALIGQPMSPLSEEQQRAAPSSPPLKTQSKISSFFSSSQRK